MNKDSIYIFKKKIHKLIFYLLLIIVVIFLAYFLIPKFLNYTTELIKESLKKNNELNIKNISNTKYRLFPSPRLRVYGNGIEFEENLLKIEKAQIDIVLNPLNLINYKTLDYDRLLISGGLINIKINKVNQLLNFIKKNKKNINFKKNTIIVFQKNKKLFEIDNSIAKVYSKNNTQQVKISGLLLNHKINFFFYNEPVNKINITLDIPKLNISTSILLERKDNSKIFEGLINLVVQNNFFQFNFIKEKNIIVNKGFIRNNLINLSLKGEIFLKPNFFFYLDIKPTRFDIEKLFFIVQKMYFSENPSGLKVISKINGTLNFENIINGKVIFENRKILFKNFKTRENNPIFFDAKISEFGKKGKIKFNLHKNILHKNNSNKDLKISGFIIPFSTKVIFEKISLDNKNLKAEKIKNYEEKFNKEVINNSLDNIFINSKINNFVNIFSN